MVKAYFLVSVLFMALFYNVFSVYKISDEGQLSGNTLELAVKNFNSWHYAKYPGGRKVELRIKGDGQLGIFAKEEIKVLFLLILYPKGRRFNFHSR